MSLLDDAQDAYKSHQDEVKSMEEKLKNYEAKKRAQSQTDDQ